MANRLTTLVQGTDDPYLLDYAVKNLGDGVPRTGDWDTINRVRRAALEKKLFLNPPLAKVMRRFQRQELAEFLDEQDQALKGRVESLRELARQDPDILAAKLRDDDVENRLTGLLAVALKRGHLEGELIERLNDRSVDARRLAHRVLVLLARGTDFGPTRNANRAQRLLAIHHWRQWWAVQDAAHAGLDAEAATDASAPGRPPAQDDDQASLTAVYLEKVDPQSAALSMDLVKAPPERQEEVLAKLRDTKGVVYTEALAASIPLLPSGAQARARSALAERMTRMTAKTLRDKFKDDDDEVRHAAALAAGMKKDEALIPDLIALLDDAEPVVARGARAALKNLTGQDFGPRAGGTDAEHIAAVTAWSGWWKKHKPE
ncbi:MAG TPA: HEAT repeat domain-containing protein [Gemmataceae bacterium]|jgi:hypothetical protein|nr:HEAT repeat domain-containing protein [Gemmataceae bacterium]